MKKSKFLAMIAAGALTVSLGAFALTGCANGTDYTFEAEDAVLEGQGWAQMPGGDKIDISVEPGVEWNGAENGEAIPGGAEVTSLGYFNAEGQTITWNITSSAECDATLTLRAASAVMSMPSQEDFANPDFDYENAQGGLASVDMSKNEYITLKVNNEQASLNGTLPATLFPFAEMWNNVFSTNAYKHFGTATAKIHLKEGQNTVVISATGAGGLNIDKITINASSTLTFEKTDNG